jgi:hypothetical protein
MYISQADSCSKPDAPSATDADPTCEHCGRAIEDMEELLFVRAADLVAQWEAEDAKRKAAAPVKKQPYRTPQATIDAFWYVVRNHDAGYLAKWLANHPKDIDTLTRLLEAKNGLV